MPWPASWRGHSDLFAPEQQRQNEKYRLQVEQSEHGAQLFGPEFGSQRHRAEDFALNEQTGAVALNG